MGHLEDAVKVFKLNIGFFPNSAFCYDSMSDAYIKTGENDLAIKCTEKAIELLPNDMDLSAGYKIKLEEILQTKLKEINKTARISHSNFKNLVTDQNEGVFHFFPTILGAIFARQGRGVIPYYQQDLCHTGVKGEWCGLFEKIHAGREDVRVREFYKRLGSCEPQGL